MKRITYVALLAILPLIACQKEISTPIEEPAAQELYTIYASVASKTAVNASTGEFSWVSDEGISVAPTSAGGYNNTYTCSDPATGAFTGTGAPGSLAISPAQDGTFTSATEYQVTLPVSYTWKAGVTNALLVGAKVGDVQYQFKHAAALLAVTFENVPANTSTFRVVSTGAGQQLTGTVTLSGTAVSDIEITNGNASLSGSQVEVTFEKTTATVPSMTFYVPVPTGSYDEIVFSLVNDDAAITASTVKTLKNATLNRANVVVFPTITLADGFVPKTVGNADCTSGWGTAWSELFTIQKGQVLHLEFVNHSDKTAWAHNWVMFVTNNVLYDPDAAVREASGYSEYFVLRADNYGWGTNYTPSTLVSNYNWATFSDDFDGATVGITVEYTSFGSLIVKSTCGDYFENYSHPVPLTDGAVGAFLWCDNSCFDIKKVWYTDSRKTDVTGIKSAYNYYVYDQALGLDTIGWPKDVIAVYNDGDQGRVLPSEIGFPAGQTLAAAAGNQDYTVTYGGESCPFTIPVVVGTGAFGSTTLVTSGIQFSSFFGDVAAGSSVSKKLFVYSSCANNWASPCADAASAGFASFYASVRMDNFGWGDNYAQATPASNWDWDVFTAMQNHDTVTLTWTNNTSTATVRFDALYWDGKTHYQEYAGFGITNGELAYRAFTEGSYVVVID